MESPSASRWLGVGAALTGLPAAGGCVCAALMLALAGWRATAAAARVLSGPARAAAC